MRRTLLVATVTMVFVGLLSGTALAHECINASKSDQAAGAQVILGPDFQTPIYISQGLQERLEHGVIDSDTFEEEFHGLIAFDADGDGVADLSTWIGVGPTGGAARGPVRRSGLPRPDQHRDLPDGVCRRLKTDSRSVSTGYRTHQTKARRYRGAFVMVGDRESGSGLAGATAPPSSRQLVEERHSARASSSKKPRVGVARASFSGQMGVDDERSYRLP